MKAIEKIVLKRLTQRFPSSIKNPRKLKKAWKGCVLANVRKMGIQCRFRLHWVPRNGWTVTAKAAAMRTEPNGGKNAT